MIYEKGTDGSYFHNNLLIRRDDDPNPGAVFNNNKSITAFLNGYAIIPLKKYCELTNQKYDDTLIKEVDKQLHN